MGMIPCAIEMQSRRRFSAAGWALAVTWAAGAGGCGNRQAPPPPLPPPQPLVSDEQATERSIAFFATKLKEDPYNFIAYNKIAGLHLKRLRETGNIEFLTKALDAAKASLKLFPAEMNLEGLGVLASAEYASHNFRAARDHARQWVQLQPNEGAAYGLLGDACLELGDYRDAERAYRDMERNSRRGAVGIHSRLARWCELKGDLDGAQQHLARALEHALSLAAPPRETVAWCRWQTGELAFLRGDYSAAEQHQRDALTVYPGYYRGIASLGRALAALGRRDEAIAQYERVVQILPDPTYVAALGDLYHLAGKSAQAEAQYTLVEQIGRLGKLSGQLYNRQLALFYADHDRKPEDAYSQATREYQERKDIYGADTVAWAALKAGKIEVARREIRTAFRLGTVDPRLYFHAGMIAKAAGDGAGARQFLEKALQLCPEFDPLQAMRAREALEGR